MQFNSDLNRCVFVLALLKLKHFCSLVVALEDVDGHVADNSFPSCLGNLVNEKQALCEPLSTYLCLLRLSSSYYMRRDWFIKKVGA